MPPSLRIARVDVGNYRLLTADFAGLEGLHRELTATIRRHLPATTSSLLALPVPADDGATVDWYSDLAGQPIPLASLPPDRRALVRDKLKDRLRSLQRLADELPRRVRGSEDLASALRAATHYPGDEHVFAVGDEPVLTLWGFVRTSGRGRLATPTQASAQGNRRRWLLGLALTAVAMVALAGAGWYAWTQGREQTLRDEIAEALASACKDPDRFAVLDHRLQQFAPDGRMEDLRRQIDAEQQHCAQAAVLETAITAAGWDCTAIAALTSQRSTLDLERPPMPALSERIDQRLAVCDQAARLTGRFEQELGNCEAIARLASALPTEFASAAKVAENGDDPAEPLARLQSRIEAEIALCASAAALTEEIVTASAQCEPLLRLDGRLAELDTTRAPLLPVRERLDAELALCAQADAFSRDLIDAQMDCTRLKALGDRMQGDEMALPPLLPVRQRLDQALEQCRALDSLEQSLRDAGQDCGRLADLAEEIRDAHPSNPIFLELRRRIAGDTRLCDLAERLRAELATASGNCDALVEFAPRLKTAGAPDGQLSALNETLKGELALCADADDWRQRISDAGDDCLRLGALQASLPTTAARSGQFSGIVTQLTQANQHCRQVALAAAEAERSRRAQRTVAVEPKPAQGSETAQASDAKAGKSTPAKQRCPGTRKVSEAPQLVMVFDASGSMGHGINATPAVLRQLQQAGDTPLGAVIGILGGLAEKAASGPSRMQAAKDAGRRIVSQLPGDVDVGLVKIEDCPGATNAGFYPPARRGNLLGQLGALQPRGHTPLASAIAQAAAMLDGVTRPGVIAIISDGEDTCGGNVCATAARIARSQPQIKINVVDIAGIGGANCAASATGGRVLRAGNAAELSAQMQRATEEVMGPAECRGG